MLLLDRGFAGVDAGKAPWLLAGAKTLSYAVNMAALRYARDNCAEDVIFLGSDGALLEAPTATVVAAFGDTLVTPAPEGVLDSITVRRLFAAARENDWHTKYRQMTAAELRRADGVWLASSVRLLAPVIAIDGTDLAPTRLTGRIAALLGVPGF